jgi:hypothetical protein
MTTKNQTFAFIAGEVAPAFYGRLDLDRYPVGLKTAENFFVDYHGGLFNRAGTSFISMLPEQVHLFAKFRTKTYDLVLFFTAGKMRVLRNKKFIHSAADAAGTVVNGLVTAANTVTVGQLVWLKVGAFEGYFTVSSASAGGFQLTSPIGWNLPNGAATWAPVYERSTTFTDADIAGLKVSQDFNRVVCTRDTRLPVFITRVADNNWTIANFTNVLPTAPGSVAGVASGSGSASVGFAVTAVINGVESGISVVLVTSSIVNYSVTAGSFTLTWGAVAGAERYNVYRSIIYPGAYPTGAQLSYVGYTTGTSFVDNNIVSDGSKTIPELVDFFSGNNFPAVYSRFQQRGVYAGLANEPLTIVGSLAFDKSLFSLSFPPVATDSYSYTIDAESERPIKHMLALRYGLMLFTEDNITQLRGGGDNVSITALNAIAEPQAYVSVSDLSPLAINLDVIFLTSLNTEVNQMVYTEYTNSFKMQDILVLSSHLFGPDNKAVDVTWSAEPHKLVHYVREDGQRVCLTYERNFEVYGWTRARTQGDYLKLISVTEDSRALVYQTVRRTIKGLSVMFLEREEPRRDRAFNEMWYVDAGVSRQLLRPNYVARLELNESIWTLHVSDVSWAALNQVIYLGVGMFRVTAVTAGKVTLAVMVLPDYSEEYNKTGVRFKAGSWGYNTVIEELDGLWWLDGETVSVLHDGDAEINIPVVNSKIKINTPSAFIVAGLSYTSRGESLPLSLPQYVLGGSALTLRGLAIRQLQTRGLAVGTSFDNLEDLPSRSYEDWGNPLSIQTELTNHELWGSGDWSEDAMVCFTQRYPLPAAVIGYTFDLDVGG